MPAQQWEYEAGVSEEVGRVIEPRNVESRGQKDSLSEVEAKSRRFASTGRQQSWVRYRRVRRTPPGSESGACLQRGNVGTWENHLSPSTIPGLGDRATKGPGVTWGLPPGHEPDGDNTNAEKQARYREASDE